LPSLRAGPERKGRKEGGGKGILSHSFFPVKKGEVYPTKLLHNVKEGGKKEIIYLLFRGRERETFIFSFFQPKKNGTISYLSGATFSTIRLAMTGGGGGELFLLIA